MKKRLFVPMILSMAFVFSFHTFAMAAEVNGENMPETQTDYRVEAEDGGFISFANP